MAEKEATVDLSGEMTTMEEEKPKPNIMSLVLSSPKAKEWIQSRRQNIRPWNTFFESKKFKVPVSLTHSSKRVVRNIEHFQSNYLFVFLGLVLFCILTSPLLLVAIGASLGACYIIKIRHEQGNLKIFGHELTLVQQYAAIAIISFPLFYISGAGSAVFWVLGMSFFLIMLHATLYSTDAASEEELFGLQMEQI